MSELIFENVSLEINKTKIASNISFCSKGLCCIYIDSESGDYKELPLLFSKAHLYSTNDIKISGNVYFNGKILPASKFHHLLNQHIVFEGNETIINALSLINKEEAEDIIRDLEITFTNKKASHLSIQESRIFEIAVNLAAKPSVMYLKTLGMSQKQKEKCLIILSELIKHTETVIFIESDYSTLFGCALIVKNDGIISLDKEGASKFFMEKELAPFQLRQKPFESTPCDCCTKKTNELYDYKKSFVKYKTSNIIDLKHKNMSFFDRLTTFDFYKLNFWQALVLGYKKYEMTFQKQEKRVSIIKSLTPCFFLIFLLRFIDEITNTSKIDYTPGLIALICDAVINRNGIPALILFFLESFIFSDLSSSKFRLSLKKFFRDKFSELGLRLIFASVCFSIMYQYSSIFEEDFQALNYNINVLMTPGTYIASIFVFTTLAHITTFCFVGWIFNIQLMTINLICAFFINLICFGFLGKRFRTTFIGFFISTVLFSAMIDNNSKFSYITNRFFFAIFPILVNSQQYNGENISQFMFSLFYLLIYCSVIYVITCFRLSFY